MERSETVVSLLETVVKVTNKNGLHARPSSVLAAAALQFENTTVKLRRGDLEVDAKSIMELLLLEAQCGSELTLVTEGPQAQGASDAVRALFEREFDLKL